MVRRTLEIARALARRKGVRAAAALLLAAGAASGVLPLLDAPGYELAEAGALLAALVLGPWLGIAAARAEQARTDPSPGAAAGAAALVSAALLTLLLLGSAARAALGPCHALAGVAFFPALALPSALLASALGAAAGALTRGRRLLAGVAYALTVAACLALVLRRAYLGPAAFAWSPLLGAFPGPLYDEALPLDARFVLGAIEAVAWALVVGAAAEAAARLARPDTRARGAAAAPALLALAAAGGVLGARQALSALGLDGDRATVARALGGRRDGPRCTLVLPAETPDAAAAALLAECEFHAADVARALGLVRPPRVTVYVHRSAAEKRRLVGAAGTEYAKPWLAEIHLSAAPLPHPLLRHELVHALAASLAPGPLHVPARARVLPSPGLIEGLAVALEVPHGAWTIHQWSRAARDLGLLPDLARIVGPAGFWAQAPARAYTAAGSFLAFLLERHGAAAVARAYGSGDLASALGRPLPALIAEWQAFLDGVTVPDGLRAAARARLSRPSLFARPCAREAAGLQADAAGAAAGGRTAEACDLYRQAARLTGSPRDLAATGDVLARAGDLPGARAAYAEAAALASPEDVALRAALAAARGDLAWRAGDAAAARAAWREALAAGPDRAEGRLLEAKAAAAADPALSQAARAYLLGGGDPAAALARVARVDRPLAAYLVGRALWLRGETGPAARELARAAEGSLPPALAAEARLVAAEARCAAGDRAGGAAALASLRAALPADADADRARLDEALRRCAFEASGPAEVEAR